MRNTRRAAATLVVLACLPALARADAARATSGAPELVLQLDFYGVEGATVPDGSGRGHDGVLERAKVVEGRGKPAVQFDGDGRLTVPGAAAPDAALTVGAMCRPDAPDGVIASWGDERDSLTLSLQGGVPVFALHSGGTVRAARSDEPLETGRWVHLAGVVGADGRLSLLVDTWPVGEAKPAALAKPPAAPLLVGRSAAGGAGFRGLLQDLRVYRGAVSRDSDRDLLAEWANRPGCGCRGQQAERQP